LLCLVAACVFNAPALTQAGTGAPDSQLWSELDITARVSTNTTVTGIGQARVSESLPNPVFTGLGGDLNYRHGDVTLSTGYRHQLTGHGTDEPKVTQLALLIGTYAPQFGSNTIALRCRVENAVNASGNPWRIRLRAEYRWATDDLGPITYVFANDEVFYQFQASEWYRNRFQAGVNFALGRRLDLLVYYQRQDDRLNTPGALNVLGLILKATLK
jgi:hypothetical protein